MSLICPNKNTKAWKNLINKVGEVEAYYQYNLNDHNIPDFTIVTEDDAFDYVKSFSEISAYKDKLYIKAGDSQANYHSNISSVKSKIDEVNKVFPNLLILSSEPIIHTEKSIKYNNGRTLAYYIDINPEALVEYKKLFKEPIVIEQRVNDKLQPEIRKDFEKKKELMLKSFPFVKEVIEDYNINVAGMVLAGGNIIKVNPKYWTTDTIGHEFAHVIIDSIGGLENPLVKKGIELLENSDIWFETKERYQNLFESDINKFKKEVLAEAIGRETVIQFENQQKQSQFQRWLERLFYKIRQLFGIENNAIKELARKIIKGSPISGTEEIYENYQQRKKTITEEIRKERNIIKPENDLKKIYDKMLKSLQIKSGIYSQAGKVGKIDSIKTVIKNIKKLDEDIPSAIESFVNFAVGQTNAIYARYDEAIKKKELDPNYEAFNIKELARWRDYVLGFKSLDDIVTLAQALSTSTVETEENKKLKSLFERRIKIFGGKEMTIQQRINETINHRNEIEKTYKKEGIKQIAKWLTPYSKHIEADYREKAEIRYNDLTKEEKRLKSKEKYIREQLELFGDDIKEATKDHLENELNKASNDVKYLDSWLDNILDSPDIVVSSMVSAFSDSIYKSRHKFIELNHELVNIVRDLENSMTSDTGIFNKPEKMYEFMLEKDNNGNFTGEIVDVYKSSLKSAYNNYRKTLQNKGIVNEDLNNKLNIWKDKNVPLTNESRKRREKDLFKFLDKLYKDEIIDNVELYRLKNQQDNLAKKLVTLGQLKINEHASELYNEWWRENAWNYRVPTKEWINSQWLKLVELAGGDTNSLIIDQIEQVRVNKSNNIKIKFYNFITEKSDELEKALPYNSRLKGRLPGIYKDVNERLKSGNSLRDTMKYAGKDTFNIMSDETERGTTQLIDESGEKVLFIPIYYTNNLISKFQEEFYKFDEEIQNDVIKKYKNDYIKESQTIKDSIDIIDYAAEQYAREKAHKEQSYDLAGIYSRYFQSAIDYSEKYQILPQMEMARFLIKEREVTRRTPRGKVLKYIKGDVELSKKGSESNIYHQFEEWYEALMYGIKEKDQGTIFNGKVDVGKLADAMNKFTSINLLGVNFIQGVANVVLGSTMQMIESYGGKFYGKKDLSKANIYYGRNLGGILNDIGTRHPRNIVSLLNEEFDILNEYSDGKYRKNSKFRRLLSTNTLFFTTHAGEHFMQSKVMLAMLNKMEAKIGDKVVGNMLEMSRVSKDGKLIFETKDGKKITNFNEDDRILFNKRVKRVLSSIHGEYSNEGRVAIQRYALGRMALMFRKFVVTGFRRRWGKKRINNLLGEYVEGNYRSFGKFVGNFIKDLEFLRWNLASEHWGKLTELEKTNIRRTFGEIAFLLSAIILSKLLLEAKSEDEDDEWLVSFLAYQALRMKAELFFFANPNETLKILKSPAAAMSLIENTIKLFSQVTYPITSLEWKFETYEKGNWKGKPKINKTIVNYIPTVKQIYRAIYVDDQISWLNR